MSENTTILDLLHQSTTPRGNKPNTCPKCAGTGLNLKEYAYELKKGKMVPYHPPCSLCHGTKVIDTTAKIGDPIGIPVAA